jgi:hypothetical protein
MRIRRGHEAELLALQQLLALEVALPSFEGAAASKALPLQRRCRFKGAAASKALPLLLRDSYFIV